jgi:predicted transcriptional regulator YdeE
MRVSKIGLLLFLISAGAAQADDNDYTGPFYMCPDAHGQEQKSLFRTMDITGLPMRIEGLGETRVLGYGAQLAASRSPTTMKDGDPIGNAFEKLFGTPNTMSADQKRRLMAVCFATTPPPKEDIDGPFVFMPGFLVNGDQDMPPMDSVNIPPQTYLVVTYNGPSEDIGSFRFTMTEEFWPKTAPILGLERVDGPNLMVWAPGLKGNEVQAQLELWTPIKPFKINPP